MSKHTSFLVSWSAGFFEGEGWICQHKRKAYDRLALRSDLMAGIVNTEKSLLEVFQHIWGGRIRPRKGTTLSRKPLFDWRLECKKAERFLKDILPYIQGKKKQKIKESLILRKLVKPMARRSNGTFKPKQ